MQFQISCRSEMRKETLDSSSFEFLEKFLGNNFVLSDASEDNTSGQLNRRGRANLPLLTTL